MRLKDIGKKWFDSFLDNVISDLNGGITLQEATKNAPNVMGCYKIFCEGEIKYVGKAEYGLRHRFVQYYNGTTTSYSSGKMIYNNRERVTVSWKICKTKEECRALEAEWIRTYNPPWNKQSGWGNY